ncbi:MAG: Na+/H+ antiporter [Subtercola sp.]|jgi:Ca2+/Na+ antiporter|nr:Na+/H+ antiporter [Subtercola sp.]
MISLFDTATATALAQILPVLLLALMVELRRTEMHRRGRRIRVTRGVLASFFGAFAIIETVLVLSIDGRLYPFQLSDLIAALIIFALLWLLFVMSMVPSRHEREKAARAKKQSTAAQGESDDAADDADDSSDDEL